MNREVRVSFDLSKPRGHLLVYAFFRDGEIHTTYELAPGLNADVDREGRVLGVEVVRLFPKNTENKITGLINLDEIQAAVEKRFHEKLDEEFQEIREAAHVFA